LAINQKGILVKQILSFFVSSALLSLFDVASREHRRTYFILFTFVFKYSLCKALVKAHAFYGQVSLETLFNSRKRAQFIHVYYLGQRGSKFRV